MWFSALILNKVPFIHQYVLTGRYCAKNTQDEITCFRISETWRKHATPCFRYVYVLRKRENESLRVSVTLTERKCQVTFPSYLSQHISAVVRFRHVSANGFAVFCYILPKHKREMVLWTTRNLNATAVLFNPVRPNETVVWLRSVGANETIVSFDLVDPNETSCVIWSGYPKKTVVCTELVGPNETAKIRHCII